MSEINYKLAAETATIKKLITEIYPTGVVSLVSDSYDFWSVISKSVPLLKNEILSREVNAIGLAKVVFRPDSGNPVDILCGTEVFNADKEFPEVNNLEVLEDWLTDRLSDKVANETEHGEPGEAEPEMYVSFKGKTYLFKIEICWNRYDKQYYYMDGVDGSSLNEITLSPEQKGAVECLWEVFGGTVTEEGYKVLNERVGLIYGDSITLERAEEIMSRLEKKGFASCNVVLGVGSYTYQYNTRDTFGFAMKATYGEVDGVGREIFKDPITDNGTKKSAKGLLCVTKEGDDFVLRDSCTREDEMNSLLKPVFKDGKLLVDQSLSEIRNRLLGN